MILFDENNEKKYTKEILINAYENIDWENPLREKENHKYWEYNFSDSEDFFWVKIERTSKKKVDIIMKDLFSDIYLIDFFVQEGACHDYEIVGFNFVNNNIVLEYWGIKENTQFHVEVYKDKDKWYCKYIGTEKYTNPVCINNFQNGYSDET